MTPSERISRADRAKAYRDEFLAPALAHVEAEWMETLKRIAKAEDPKAPERIMRVTAGLKTIDVIRGQIEAYIADGLMAESESKQTAKIASLSEHKRQTIGA